MAAPVPARISHRIPGRVRLRIPERRDDEAYFMEMAETLSMDDRVIQITATAQTASLLVEHEASANIDDLLQSLFDLETAEEGSAGKDQKPLRRADVGRALIPVRRFCTEPNELHTAAAIALVGHGLRQLARGKTLGPDWFTAFWVAFNLLAIKK